MRAEARHGAAAATVAVLATARESAVGSPEAPVAVGADRDDNAAARHMALLASPPYAQRSGAAQRERLVRQLQAGYGNQHVSRVIARMRQERESAPQPAVQRAVVNSGKGVVQRLEADGGAAPASPEADGAFQDVVRRSQAVAAQEKAHQPPKEKSREAQAAAQPPANDVESKAEGRQVSEKMAQAPTPPFNANAFKAALMERIRQIAPQNLDQMDKFKDSGKLASVKQDMTGQVGQQRQASQGPLTDTAKETPSTSGIAPKPVTPLPPNSPGQAPADIGGEKAAPKTRGYGEIEAPLQQSSRNLDQRLAAADSTEEQLAKSNEPQFQAALDAKKRAQTDAAEAPKGYRQFEDKTLSQARSEAGATAQESLQGMYGGRSQSLRKVTGTQEGAKGKDENARTKIAGDLAQIYDQTKTTVERILQDLDTEVDREFDVGAETARQAFEDYVRRRMDDYKAARYSGFIGFFNWIRDLFAGLPDEVNRFYEEGRDRYLQDMDRVIGRIADLVADRLNKAKQEVANGKQRVETYVRQLPEDLKDIGAQAAEDILGQFDELEQEIDSKKKELIDRLASKYKENLDAIDARIKEMQEENRGLIAKAIDFIVGVIKTIVELTRLLITVLARVASAIPAILRDPIGFVRNLVNALKQGFQNFAANILRYLTQGLMSWLTGSLASAGIRMPESLDAKGLFGLALQVLGLTYQTIRARAVQRIGEQKVAYLERAVAMFRTLATQGIAGLWQVVRDRLGDMKALLLDPIEQYIIENVIRGGISWLLGLMNPASAFVKACQAIVQIVEFFMDNAQRIAELINSVIDAVLAIANGAAERAARGVENALANSIPLVIDFFAKLLGLGNIGQKVREIIQRLRQPVERAVDWVISQGARLARNLGRGSTKGRPEQPRDRQTHDQIVNSGLAAVDREEKQYLKQGRIARKDAEKVTETVKRQYPVFKVLAVIDGGATWDYDYVASPGMRKRGEPKEENAETNNKPASSVNRSKPKELGTRRSQGIKKRTKPGKQRRLEDIGKKELIKNPIKILSNNKGLLIGKVDPSITGEHSPSVVSYNKATDNFFGVSGRDHSKLKEGKTSLWIPEDRIPTLQFRTLSGTQIVPGKEAHTITTSLRAIAGVGEHAELPLEDILDKTLSAYQGEVHLLSDKTKSLRVSLFNKGKTVVIIGKVRTVAGQEKEIAVHPRIAQAAFNMWMRQSLKQGRFLDKLELTGGNLKSDSSRSQVPITLS